MNRLTRRRAGRSSLAAWWPLALIALSGCRMAPREWSEGLDQRQRGVLEAWYFCDECNRGERAAVAALLDTAVTPLDRVLRQFPPQWRANLTSRYARAAQRAQLTGADSTAYVNGHVERFRATAWSRSAFVLGDIATPNAISVLNAALQDSAARNLAPDVTKDLRRALLVATTQPLQGAPSATSGRFLDSVWVTRAGSLPWDGDEGVELIGAPFPNDVTLGFRDGNNELGFVTAAPPGEYAFTVVNVGAAQQTQHSSIRITSFPAAPYTTVRNLTAGPFPVTILQSFSRRTTPRDVVHYFRFAPAGPLSVTAVADWSGPSVIDLVWDDCSNRMVGAYAPGQVRGVIVNTSGLEVMSPVVHVSGPGDPGVMTAMVSAGPFSQPVAPGFVGTARVTAPGYVPAEVVAWEGAGDLRVVMQPAPATPLMSTRSSGQNPISASLTIPPGACRLLGVLKSDTTSDAPIVRLRVTSP